MAVVEVAAVGGPGLGGVGSATGGADGDDVAGGGVGDLTVDAGGRSGDPTGDVGGDRSPPGELPGLVVEAGEGGEVGVDDDGG